jgi:hypothetical protein
MFTRNLISRRRRFAALFGVKIVNRLRLFLPRRIFRDHVHRLCIQFGVSPWLILPG